MRHIIVSGGVALALCSCATGRSAFGQIKDLHVTGYGGGGIRLRFVQAEREHRVPLFRKGNRRLWPDAARAV
jgi:hypothetical protein